MKKQKVFLAGSMALASAFAFGGLSVHAVEPTATNVNDVAGLKTCLESDVENICALNGDITPGVRASIDIPANVKKTLDLRGYAVKSVKEDIAEYRVDIDVKGELKIQSTESSPENKGSYDGFINASGNGKLTIDGGNFYNIINSNSDDGVSEIKITGGTFNKIINANKNNKISIIGGTFKDAVSVSNNASLNITGGLFEKAVSSSGESEFVIENGTFNDSVSAFSSGKNKIINGTFNGKIHGGSAKNSYLEIFDGVFEEGVLYNIYVEGSTFIINGGTFKKGFGIDVETLKITGGKFTNNDSSWMYLVIGHPEIQKYSITGGEFLNTSDKYGNLIAIHTKEVPTEASIRELFKGGDVLKGCWIELGKTNVTEEYITRIKKVKTAETDNKKDEDDKNELQVPNTGLSTMNDDNMDAASVVATAVSIIAASLALGAGAYFGLHKKVNFAKK